MLSDTLTTSTSAAPSTPPPTRSPPRRALAPRPHSLAPRPLGGLHLRTAPDPRRAAPRGPHLARRPCRSQPRVHHSESHAFLTHPITSSSSRHLLPRSREPSPLRL